MMWITGTLRLDGSKSAVRSVRRAVHIVSTRNSSSIRDRCTLCTAI